MNPAMARGLARRILPLLAVAAAIAAFFAFGLDRYVTFEALREHRHELLAFVAERPLLALFAYMVVYAVAVALSLPGGLVLTIAGGFLFGLWLGTLVVVIAATVGATLIFLAARYAMGDLLRARAGPFLKAMEEGFRRDAMSYLLVLRLVPLFPFFVVNLVPAFLGVPLRTYVVATFFGIIPGTFVFASVGAGLGSIFDSGQEFTAKGILTPEIILALSGLAVLALVPVVYRRIGARRSTAPRAE
ncbi:MAG: TVP38/TMEM64 family protein [Alphaproteobacteria bacterium]|nr:TVP38/TMEM64 family protein [Alphaproteobacteria bacterium]